MASPQYLFVHIPKTAGTSIRDEFKIKSTHHSPTYNKTDKTILLEKLNVAVQIKNYQRFISFAVLRHPYDRFLSAYQYLYHRNSNSFKVDFAYYQMLHKYSSLDDVLNDLSNLKNKIVHFVDQHNFVCDSEGKILVNHVLKFENLVEDLKTLNSKWPALKKTNPSPDMQISLTPDQKQKIYQAYKRDFEIFGFSP